MLANASRRPHRSSRFFRPMLKLVFMPGWPENRAIIGEFDSLERRYPRNAGAERFTKVRFQPGVGCPKHLRRPRGPGRGSYRMSRAAYQARLRNLAGLNRPRTNAQTQRIQVEIA